MEQRFADYLDRVRAHRAELGEAIRALEDSLALPPEPVEVWRRRVRASLTELAHDLRDHVALTEAPDGLYADLVDAAPRLSSAVDAQLADHRYFLDEVNRLLDDRDSGLAGLDTARHRAAIEVVLARLMQHRQRGSDLIHSAYEVDIGGSG